MAVFAAGTIAMCGYAVLLIFYRALVRSELLVGPIEGITDDVGIVVFLAVFLGAFYLGELLLAVALWRVRSVPRWVAIVLGAARAHAGRQPVAARERAEPHHHPHRDRAVRDRRLGQRGVVAAGAGITRAGQPV